MMKATYILIALLLLCSCNGLAQNRLKRLVTEAQSYHGVPYRFGGETRSGIDCSSFVKKAFAAIEVYLPRTSIQQSRVGRTVSQSQLRAGDLLFFSFNKRQIQHVGLVVSANGYGNIVFIHASKSHGVCYQRLTPYFQRSFQFAKRIL